MTDRENTKKQAVIQLLKEHLVQAPNTELPPISSGSIVYVSGDGNAVAGGKITHNITHNHAPIKKKVFVKTGDGVIDSTQKAELTRLRDEWMGVHNAIKKTPLTYQAAWGRFNKAMKISGYAELKPENFDTAVKWFRKQIAILNGMPSAPKKVAGYRGKRISAIKARCKNQLLDEASYYEYITRHFMKSSLTELDDKELELTYRYVIGKEV